MDDAILAVADRLDLPPGWLNSDFTRTRSYSPKLVEHSKYYKTFSNILTVRTVSEEYLIAMKLMSARPYKNDLSDIFGILAEQYYIGKPISLDRIKQAVIDLYGAFDFINADIWSLIEKGSSEESLTQIYNEQRNGEVRSKELLVQFDENYKNVLNEDNLENILKKLKESENTS